MIYCTFFVVLGIYFWPIIPIAELSTVTGTNEQGSWEPVKWRSTYSYYELSYRPNEVIYTGNVAKIPARKQPKAPRHQITPEIISRNRRKWQLDSQEADHGGKSPEPNCENQGHPSVNGDLDQVPKNDERPTLLNENYQKAAKKTIIYKHKSFADQEKSQPPLPVWLESSKRKIQTGTEGTDTTMPTEDNKSSSEKESPQDIKSVSDMDKSNEATVMPDQQTPQANGNNLRDKQKNYENLASPPESFLKNRRVQPDLEPKKEAQFPNKNPINSQELEEIKSPTYDSTLASVERNPLIVGQKGDYTRRTETAAYEKQETLPGSDIDKNEDKPVEAEESTTKILNQVKPMRWLYYRYPVPQVKKEDVEGVQSTDEKQESLPGSDNGKNEGKPVESEESTTKFLNEVKQMRWFYLGPLEPQDKKEDDGGVQSTEPKLDQSPLIRSGDKSQNSEQPFRETENANSEKKIVHGVQSPEPNYVHRGQPSVNDVQDQVTKNNEGPKLVNENYIKRDPGTSKYKLESFADQENSESALTTWIKMSKRKMQMDNKCTDTTFSTEHKKSSSEQESPQDIKSVSVMDKSHKATVVSDQQSPQGNDNKDQLDIQKNDYDQGSPPKSILKKRQGQLEQTRKKKVQFPNTNLKNSQEQEEIKSPTDDSRSTSDEQNQLIVGQKGDDTRTTETAADEKQEKLTWSGIDKIEDKPVEAEESTTKISNQVEPMRWFYFGSPLPEEKKEDDERVQSTESKLGQSPPIRTWDKSPNSEQRSRETKNANSGKDKTNNNISEKFIVLPHPRRKPGTKKSISGQEQKAVPISLLKPMNGIYSSPRPVNSQRRTTERRP